MSVPGLRTALVERRRENTHRLRIYGVGRGAHLLRTMNTSTSKENRQIVEKMRSTRLFQTYASAFQAVTGLRLSLHPMHDSKPMNTRQSNPFCSLLNGSHGCRACQHIDAELMRAAPNGVETRQCHMGLAETAVPVRFGEETIAVLRTGQVRHKQPEEADISLLTELLKEHACEDESVEHLADAYRRMPVLNIEIYKHAITILSIFSLQLSTLVSQLMMCRSDREPPLVTKAKAHVREHLEDKITLTQIARLTRVSPFYFCKVFKRATGMTFTVYVNRERIEWAKKQLLNPRLSVTEVAYDVGYQSLSQFNRSFRKFAELSPSAYRKQMRTDADETRRSELAA